MTCYYLLNLYLDRLLLYNRLALYCVLKDITFDYKKIMSFLMKPFLVVNLMAKFSNIHFKGCRMVYFMQTIACSLLILGILCQLDISTVFQIHFTLCYLLLYFESLFNHPEKHLDCQSTYFCIKERGMPEERVNVA